ncbi:MAG TPA: UvrB/UvrC motif-containing protein [Sedimentisphaerales bacterium]|nr:UvrB/UvrC motif-containing protein [Sedimentisphaerales bacterium]
MPVDMRSKNLEAIRRQIGAFPTGPGLYFMKGRADKVLYIGKAKNLRSRVAGYFQQSADPIASRGPKIAEMVAKVEAVDFLETPSEVDAMLQEARLIKDIRPPYNTDLTDDKTFPYLEITSRDDFPGVYITRKPRPSGSTLFGPFTGAKDLRGVLVVLQKIFKFRTCNLKIAADDPKRTFFRPCILYSIKQCTAPCAARIDKAPYKKVVIGDLVRFLRSKRSVVMRRLKNQMAEAAERLDYESAAMFRDRIRLIERLDRRGTPDENVQPEVFAADPALALTQLRDIIQCPDPVRIIEGIDVANIGGAEAVGSLVKFIDGKPFKSGYRRFKIKTVKGIDDYAMIAEVVKRRYKYAMQGREMWPDLILIDGGLGHLRAAQAALDDMIAADRGESKGNNKKKANPVNETPKTKIASIAKKQELIYVQPGGEPLNLPANSPARKLLQYVRDEAHRFAQHYHHILRSKKMFNKKVMLSAHPRKKIQSPHQQAGLVQSRALFLW